MINISINLGPGVIWLSMIFVTFWIGVACYRAGWIAHQIANVREIEKRQSQLLIAPWQAPGPPLLVHRVDPGLALLSTYTPQDEEEAA
jgi:hypothetical protein